MSDITIVTAFFDIGRGDWSPDKGLPHYLQRTTDTYIERFSNLAKLDNDMVVITSNDLIDKIKPHTNKNTSIITVDFQKSFIELREKIKSVQSNPEYLQKINPSQIRNPEYWSADYVLVNLLKSHFVNLSQSVINTDLIAWVDFGYCRTKDTLGGHSKWQYPFDKDKIHFFNIKEWVEGTYIQDVISNNDVHITGPCIVGGKEVWEKLQMLVQHNTNELLKNNLIDDDQTLLLMSYLTKPDMFELHPVSKDDWFIVFKDYNESVS
jgi:protein YibB